MVDNEIQNKQQQQQNKTMYKWVIFNIKSGVLQTEDAFVIDSKVFVADMLNI
jgi:hypothetical protein